MYDSISYDDSDMSESLRGRGGKSVAMGADAWVYCGTNCPWVLSPKSARRGVRSMSSSDMGATSEFAESERNGAIAVYSGVSIGVDMIEEVGVMIAEVSGVKAKDGSSFCGWGTGREAAAAAADASPFQFCSEELTTLSGESVLGAVFERCRRWYRGVGVWKYPSLVTS